MSQYQNLGLVTKTTLINENIKILEKCKEYGQIVLEKCHKLREKCWKCVIFCLSIVGSDVKPGIFHSPRLHSLPRQCGSCRQRRLSADIHGDVRHSFVASCIGNPRRHLTLHPLENPEICTKSD